MSLWLRHLLGLAHCRPPFARRPRSREPGSASATIDAPCQTASSTARDLRQVVLVALRRAWSGWKRSLILVMPETVVRWHRAGFRFYWSWIWRARKAVGRKPISREVRDLISAWSLRTRRGGAPRIHGELLKLGFEISERTVSRREIRDCDPVQAHQIAAVAPRDSAPI